MLAECYTSVPYDADLIGCMFPPQSVIEAAVLLADALWELGDKGRLRELPSPGRQLLRVAIQRRLNCTNIGEGEMSTS